MASNKGNGPAALVVGVIAALVISGQHGTGHHQGHFPGGPYRNPLRDVHGLSAGRIDMGADFGGRGPVHALGRGVITEYGDGWLGAVGAPYPGTFITERLTRGRYKGRFVYVAEDIRPNRRLHVRSGVTSDTVLGRLSGVMETGWAAGPSQPSTSAAMAAGQAAPGGDPGAYPTAYGRSYSELLRSLGAP